MRAREYPTQEYLKQCLDYNPETGVFTWRVRQVEHFKSYHGFKVWNSKYAGMVAGSDWHNQKGKHYIRIAILKYSCKAHRLAFIYMDGSISEDIEVDHIDGNGLNNKWENLRKVTKSVNMQNTRLRDDNSSGCSGVSFNKNTGKWRARIYVNGKERSLGAFSNYEDAVAARSSAKIKYGYHENHGTERPL